MLKSSRGCLPYSSSAIVMKTLGWLMSSMLCACAGQVVDRACPSLSGTYYNSGDPPDERLAPILFGAPADEELRRAPSVTLTFDPGGQQAVVRAGTRQTVLRLGDQYVCDASGLRLTTPQETGLELGDVFSDRFTVFYTFTKLEKSGALEAARISVRSVSIAGVPLKGPERFLHPARWNRLQRSVP